MLKFFKKFFSKHKETEKEHQTYDTYRKVSPRPDPHVESCKCKPCELLREKELRIRRELKEAELKEWWIKHRPKFIRSGEGIPPPRGPKGMTLKDIER